MSNSEPQWILALREYAKTLPEANSEAILESDRNSIGIVKNSETGIWEFPTRKKFLRINWENSKFLLEGGKINY